MSKARIQSGTQTWMRRRPEAPDRRRKLRNVPPPLFVFRFHYAAFQTLRRVQQLCIDPWRGESLRGCSFLTWHCQVLSAPGLITHKTALREFLTCFIISCGTRRRTKIVHSSAHQINATFCLYVFNRFMCVCLWLWKLDIISTTCKQLASIWKAGIKKGI